MLRKTMKTILAAGTVATGLLTVVPAIAAPVMCDRQEVLNERGHYVSRIEAFPFHYLSILRSMGVDATRVEDWNGCIRAFVRTNGGETMQYFDPDTFERLR